MRIRTLVVDDDEVILSMMKTVLASRGYEVTTATSASAAKAMLATEPELDLVITDMRMETDTAGYEVVQAAAAHGTRPAIIILTAFPLLAQEGRQAGADRVLTKPTRMTELLAVIADLLEQRQRRGGC